MSTKNEKINRDDIEDILPLTPVQIGMLTHYLKCENDYVYLEQLQIKMKGKLEVERLELAFNHVIQNNEMLRTVILWEKIEKPVQIVLKRKQVKIELYDLSLCSDIQKEDAIEEIKSDESKKISLNKEPIKICLCKLSENEYLIQLTYHHILFDGWSTSVLLNELFDAYEKSLDINELPFVNKPKFKDFIIQCMNQNKLSQEMFWKKYLDGYDTKSEFFGDKKKNYDSKYDKQEYQLMINQELTKKIKDFARTQKLTHAAFYYTIWGILLQQYTNSEDIVFGTTTSGRSGIEIDGIEKMVGLFINTIPLRMIFKENKSFLELIKSVEEDIVLRIPYENTSLIDIKENSYFKNTSAELFHSIVVIENYPIELGMVNEENSIYIESVLADENTHYDLSFGISILSEEIHIKCIYNGSVFSSDFVRRLMSQFNDVIELGLHNPDIRMDKFIINSEKVCSKSINTGTQLEIPPDMDVLKMFKKQVHLYPDDVAVKCNKETLTYLELDKFSDSIANYISNHMHEGENVIGVLSHKSLNMIAVVLGIIKAGAIYLPIDITFPEERINFILQDSKVELLFAQGTANIKDEFVGIKVDIDKLDDYIDNNQQSINKIENQEMIAYMIYTSGTTGNPKGVMIQHSSLINFLLSYHQAFGNTIGNEDKCLSLTSISFDVCIAEFFAPICFGATLVLYQNENIDIQELCQLMIEESITMTYLPPSILQDMYLVLLEKKDHIKLNKLLVGVEPIEENVLRNYFRINEEICIINGYGPTETTICSTFYHFKNEETHYCKVPIGRPLSNETVYILDKNEKPLVFGGIGELCITGAKVARGYLNRPELTKQKFITNPYGEGLMYKTGDLARWLPDGNLEYMGRVDDQVKVRGFRIELGEIKNAIRKNHLVKDCVVVVRDDGTGDRIICAFVVSDNVLDTEEIIKGLGLILPSYMVPHAIMQINEIPTTKNGKIDHNRLPMIHYKSDKAYIEPRNDIEKIIAEEFSKVLGIEKIGIKDDFFELGGHSLRVIRLINQIEGRTGVRIPYKECFKASTVEMLATIVNTKIEQQQTEIIKICKAEVKEYYPMSSTQKRLYFIHKMEEDSVTYNMPVCCKMKGEVCPDQIKDIFTKMVERHEILRTKLLIKDGEALQQVIKEPEIDFTYEENNEELKTIYNRFIKPFKLEEGDVIRMKVVKNRKEHFLLVDMHHIVSDGISVGIFMKEFLQLYNGEKMEALSLQYKDYSEWMKQRDLSSQKEYWINEFREEAPVLELPYDYKRGIKQSFKGAAIHEEVTTIKEAIKELCKKAGTTEYMVILSALMVTMSKYSRQEDVVIGSPISGRTHKDIENMMGMFVNTLALRGYPSKDKTVLEFIKEIRKTCLKAYENQEYPFEELVETVDVKRDMARNPLFDIMFAFQNKEISELKLSDTAVIHVAEESSVSKFDMTFHVKEEEESYHFTVEYCTDLFKQETVERIFGHFMNILTQMCENTDQKLSELSCVDENERNLIQNVFNQTEEEYHLEKTIATLLEEQVIKTPDNIALVYGEEKITYQQFNERVNALAHRLRSMNIKPNDYVAISAVRSIEMVCGIYAILKAGAAYVPIDPTYPKERVDYILKDCKPKAILVYRTEHNVEKHLIHDVENHLIQGLKQDQEIPCIDLEDKKIWQGENKNPVLINQPEDAIYLIYTSGTTGKPKGVMNRHVSLTNLISWMQKHYPLLAGDRILFKTAFVFDVSVSEILWWSTVGAQLVILEPGLEKEPLQIAKVIEKNQITMVDFVPSMLEMFLSDPSIAEQIKGLTYIFAAGEALSSELSNRFYKIIQGTGSKTRLVNLYGPTEAAIYSSYYNCRKEEQKIPIGKPIGNVKLYILDGMNLCGIGVPGELCIAGEGLAKGYLNQVDLTEEKFIENPFDQGKLYRTGDIARWLIDGNIAYLGRMDEQVKIRGFRIELEEIASVIKGLKEIKNCVVIAREDHSGDMAIHAYLVSDDEINTDEIRGAIAKVLPEYMIPSYVMQVDQIPVTRNGKLDRNALPRIETSSIREYVAPENEIEEIICRIYGDILGLKKVSALDNFFMLGGHSLRAIKVINQIENETGIKIPLMQLFSEKTPRGLARCVMELEKDFDPIKKAEEKEYYPMSSTQKRLYFIHKMEEDSVTYNMPVCCKMKGEVCPDQIKDIFTKMVERHEILRTKLLIKDGEALQQVIKEPEIDFTYEENNEELKTIYNRFIKPFKLEEGNVIRMKVVKNRQEHFLLVDMHHIISDGISVGIFIKEFLQLYNGEKMEALSLQYKDYSEWMKQRDLSSQKEYWINEFREEAPVLELPYDYKRGIKQSFKGAAIHEEVTTIKEAIKELCKKAGTTEYMVILSALMVTMSKYSRQEDVVIGSPISGRTHKDIENMMGMFVNTLALRGYPKKDKTVLEFIKEIRKTCLKAYENQEYPFEELVETVDVKRDMARNPLFDIMFAFQNKEISESKLSDTAVIHVVEESRVSKFDMTFHVKEEEKTYHFTVEYCTDLFKQETVEGIFRHFMNILTQMCENTDQKLSELSCVDENERDLIQNVFNQTEEYHLDKTIIELLEQQVIKTPDNIALVYGEEKITYQQFNERVNALAHRLRSMDIKPNDYVAISAVRSMEMVCGIYAILKAGAAYVPIDPTYPKERVDYILKDCKPKAILVYRTEHNVENHLKRDVENHLKRDVENHLEHDVENHLIQGLEQDQEIPWIDLEDKKIWQGENKNPVLINQPEDAIYLIYTSGTTGKPKGVMNRHVSLTNLISWMQKHYPLLAEDRILFKTAFVFDVSVSEILWWSTVGAQLVILEPGLEKEPLQIAKVIEKNQITMVDFVPSMLEMFLTDPSIAEQIKGLTYIFAAGEALSSELSNRFYKIIQGTGSKTRLVNLYGPTEAAIYSSYYKCRKEEQKIPIGKPIGNVKLYILDGMNLCGIGVPGELCIAGEGLAKGYLNQVDLTEEKFIENPFDQGKLYRTGDIARWLPDGNIAYLGRIDEQVKIRGFRIELEEIASVIKGLNKVKNCVVITREDHSGDMAIHAYLVSDDEINTDEIRGAIAKVLPEYMIPSYMMQVDQIPVTRNGKLDRNALPRIETSSIREYVAPENEIEEIICRIYGDILGLKKVSALDNFFMLGGHSLRAIKVINQIENETGIKIPLMQLFSEKTPRGLARCVMELEKDFDPIKKAEEKEYYPMSSTQKRLYFIHKMEEDSVTYNMPAGLIINGELDIAKVKRTFQELMNRHEGLRTYFKIVDGEPVQYIEKEVVASIDYYEMKGQLEEEYVKFIKPFDLSKAPLIRIKVVKMADEKYLILFDMHHIISDGETLSLIKKEFSKIYNGISLPKQKLQYKDYSEWFRNRNLDNQLDYWKQVFSDDIPVLDLPTDYLRPVEKNYSGSVIKAHITSADMQKVKQVCDTFELTEYMLFLGSFMITLAKHANQEDLIVGTLMSSRMHYETENLVGMFVNTIALRGKPEGQKNLKNFFEEIKDICMKAYENQEYPFEELIDEVNVQRDMSRNPLFDVMLVLQNYEEVELTMDGMKCEELEIGSDIMSKFDITVNIIKLKQEYELMVEYSTELFTEETIRTFIDYYIFFIQQIMNNMNQKIEDLRLVREEEYDLVVHKFNDTIYEYNENETIIERFERQVKVSPNKKAIVYYDKEITYQHFNEKVNQLAFKLRNLGIKPNDTVAIIADRSIEMIVAIYGVLKSGGAYVPIDPKYPQSRLEFILKDCKPKYILSYHAAIENSTIKVIDLAEMSSWTEPKTDLEVINTVSDMAYIIYTSGTTGMPKGVMIHHSGLYNLMISYEQIYGLNEEDVVLQVANYIFDQSVWDIFGILLVGGTLCLISYEDVRNPIAIESYSNEKKVTIASFTPALITELSPEGFTSLRILDSSGEAAMKEVLRKWVGKKKVINTYGPTETTVNASSYEYQGDNRKSIPIGGPICNTQFYVVRSGKLCGVGVPGELNIAGVSLAKGYLNRQELTDEKFVKNIIGPGKMYRTGDLVRWLPDGTIEYMGRIDDQVKIRGYRIELGEIENTLRKLYKVKDCVVITKGSDADNRYICAYVVSDESLDFSELRKGLRRTLPDYMIPTGFMQISHIPVTASGKLDKHALPDIIIESANEYVKPITFIEKVVAKAFEEVLEVKNVGLCDDFFELGGHSLKAIKLIAFIKESLHIDISLKDLFHYSKVDDLSKFIKNDRECKYYHIEPIEKNDYYATSSAQKRIFIVQQKEPNSISYNIPTVIMLEGETDYNKIHKTMDVLIKRHESFRTHFDVIDEELVQVVEEDFKFDIAYENLNDRNIDDVIAGFIQPFDLLKDPLIRMKIVKEKENIHYVILDIHHIIFDGISSAVLLRDFFSVYKGEDMKPLRIQYKDFTIWQNDWLISEEIKQQENYWLDKYKDKPQKLLLPYDNLDVDFSDFNGENIDFILDVEITKKLKGMAIQYKTTLYTIMISAYSILLSKYANEEDVIIGSPYAGRKTIDLEQIVGMFVNMLSIRTKPNKHLTFTQFITQVKDEVVVSIENSDYQFDELVHKLGLGTSENVNPIFNVVFALQNIETESIDEMTIDQVKVKAYNYEMNTSKFDLLLNVIEESNYIRLSLNYRIALFSDLSIRKMTENYISIIKQVINNPEISLKDIKVETNYEIASTKVDFGELGDFNF